IEVIGVDQRFARPVTGGFDTASGVRRALAVEVVDQSIRTCRPHEVRDRFGDEAELFSIRHHRHGVLLEWRTSYPTSATILAVRVERCIATPLSFATWAW